MADNNKIKPIRKYKSYNNFNKNVVTNNKSDWMKLVMQPWIVPRWVVPQEAGHDELS